MYVKTNHQPKIPCEFLLIGTFVCMGTHGREDTGGHFRLPSCLITTVSAVRRVTADFDFTGFPPYNLFVSNVLECVSTRTLPGS